MFWKNKNREDSRKIQDDFIYKLDASTNKNVVRMYDCIHCNAFQWDKSLSKNEIKFLTKCVDRRYKEISLYKVCKPPTKE